MSVKMTPNMITYVKSNIVSGMALYYVIVGTVIVSKASIWGFGKIKDLFSKGSQ